MTVIRKLTSTGLVNAVGMLRNVQYSWVSGHADDAVKMTVELWPTLGLAQFEDLMNGRYSIVDEDLSVLLDGGAEGRRMEMELWMDAKPDVGDFKGDLKEAFAEFESVQKEMENLKDAIHRCDTTRGELLDWLNDMPAVAEDEWGWKRDELDELDIDSTMVDFDDLEDAIQMGLNLEILKDG